MSYYQLLDIYLAAQSDLVDERARRPVSCPNDGEPLSEGPGGELFCRFDGVQWPRDKEIFLQAH